MDYINDFYKSNGKHRPKWIKHLCPHYPSLRKVQRHMGIISSSSSESMSDSDLSVDSFSSQDRTRRSQKKKGYNLDSTSAGRMSNKYEHIGVDPSLGKDNELFNVSIKNVNGLEDGLGPLGIGKTTIFCLIK